ncbi:ankyrin repeat domain-containing protein 26-like [Lemur catta]|uniref:ankyrin repeat domain-containing protein 26-like n=1 Tax=Lemur catta TaxID=9447 RepID=UPI001E26CB66|nr:ankyrin repeat domain-containing protein 26-like [Lemur catta]
MESSRRRTWNQEPIRRMSTYPTIDDLSSVDTKDVSEPNLTNLTTASQQSRKNLEAKYATVRTGKGNVFEDKISDHPKEDVFECFPTTSGKVQGFLNPSFPPPEPQRKPSSGSLENCGLTKASYYLKNFSPPYFYVPLPRPHNADKNTVKKWTSSRP